MNSGGMLGFVFKAQSFVNNIGKDPQTSDGKVKGEETDGAVTKVNRSAVDIVGVAGVGAGATTLALAAGPISGVASGLTVVLSPYVAYQKRELNELGGFRGQANELRGHVNVMHQQNNILSDSIDKLESNVNDLEGVQNALDDCAKKAQTNVDRLVHVITENGRLQKLIIANMRKQVMQDILSIVVKADRNRDYTLNRVEIEMLIFRLNALPSVEFSEQNFRKLLKGKKNLTVSEVMGMLRNLLNEDLPPGEAIFTLKMDQFKKK